MTSSLFRPSPSPTPLPPELSAEINIDLARKFQAKSRRLLVIASLYQAACIDVPPRGNHKRPAIRRFNNRIMKQVNDLETCAEELEMHAFIQHEVGWFYFIP